ncbi:hypothetical protein O181_065992 [Austropuccinia psidii MF-1]|uniref:Peptidase A2 domain-containing protein n=1 Tax=Austropuccinia psidii MF-1 TaxID=1389203 RepID=A0A9Q3EYD5_9BASI|nr:hypothetical protein [Austropuccinia psidii MF-1]
MSLESINSQEQTTTQEIIIQDKMHYSCHLGMIEVSVGQEGHIVKALVDTGAELSIIPEVESIKARLPMRVLNMRLRGIGGHSTAIVGLSENTLLVLPSGDERRIHFFVARGAVHTVIGRPFLADNGIRLEHSQQQGEILSYKESDGRRLCIPICTPESKGWHTGPPRGMEMCNMARITELKNEEPKSKSPPKKVQFDIEEKKNYSGKKTNESIYHLKEEEPQKIEPLLVSSQRISNLDNNDPLLHPKFENTYSSNMEASTIEVEPVQKKGLKPKQLVKSVSNKYGKNVQWDFQCPGTQPTILEEINPTKIENSITELEVEPTNQKLETNLSEEGSIQSQEPLGLDQEIKKLNFMELEMESSTGSIGSDNPQKNPFSNLSPNCGLNSPIYVNIGWEEYPVMAIMNPILEENILP